MSAHCESRVPTGTVDAIATDHAPHAPERKDATLDLAPPGMLGLQTALPVALEALATRAGRGRNGGSPGHGAGGERPTAMAARDVLGLSVVAPGPHRRAGAGPGWRPGRAHRARCGRQHLRDRPRGDVGGGPGPARQPKSQHPVGGASDDRARSGTPCSGASRSWWTRRRNDEPTGPTCRRRLDGTDRGLVRGPDAGAARVGRRRGVRGRGHRRGPPDGVATGELVFNTVLSGYQEVVTDPSYAGQVVAFTYPHIGNYGVTDLDDEAVRPWCRGVVVRDVPPRPSSWRATGSFEEFLRRHELSGVAGIDTRRLTRHLRVDGAMGCAFGTAPESVLRAAAAAEPGTTGRDLVTGVTVSAPYQRGSGALRIVAYDFGVKETMLRALGDMATVTVVPAAHRARTPWRWSPTACFSPTGRGTPPRSPSMPSIIAELLGHVPVFGICLGHQLLAEAIGARTFKLPFGHHGGNHPVRRLDTGQVEITSQNHNYAVDGATLPTSGPFAAEVTHVNLNDGVVEGFRCTAIPAFSVQYHPEAGPGPHDAALSLRTVPAHDRRGARLMPRRTDIETVLVIGSGPIVIGQACEFDYSGTQACRVLRAEGYRVVLVNSNPATIMTDPEIADRTYVEPLDLDVLTAVVERERPDALLPTMGGQTGLNLAFGLSERGVLDTFGVELIGANAEAIATAEDRDQFKTAMEEIGLEVPSSGFATHLDEAMALGERIGFPLMIRPSFILGGAGTGTAAHHAELAKVAAEGLAASPVHQILIERSIAGWKEFELEVMRDRVDNCVVVCSIENFDPMGVHTGDSITVAPAQTLSDVEYQAMRDDAFACIRRVGVETGGSNIQFAVRPTDGRRLVIEMNPRVSRSSALASKATGFPIAKIAARLAVGYTLDEITNDITGATPASFEPTIDYVVTKIPRWAFEKLPGAVERLGTRMQSVGEVMAIGRTFPESLQKAIRSLEQGRAGLNGDRAEAVYDLLDDDELMAQACSPTPGRIFQLEAALRRRRHPRRPGGRHRGRPMVLGPAGHHQPGPHPTGVHGVVGPGRRRPRPAHLAGRQAARVLRRPDRLSAVGGSAARSEGAAPRSPSPRCAPPAWPPGCGPRSRPSTRAAPSSRRARRTTTPPTRTRTRCDRATRPRVIILGSGPNRIGQGIEFDYCCVHASMALRAAGYETVMVNCNPETVSTDYDTSDRLYFEPITAEDVANVLDAEVAAGSGPGGAPVVGCDREPRAARRRSSSPTACLPSWSSARARPRSTWPRTGSGGTSCASAWTSPNRPVASPSRCTRPSPWPTRSGTPCSCAPATCSGVGPWRSSTTTSVWRRSSTSWRGHWPVKGRPPPNAPFSWTGSSRTPSRSTWTPCGTAPATW